MMLRLVEYGILFETEDSMYRDLTRMVKNIRNEDYDVDLIWAEVDKYDPLGLFVGLFG